jgi:hypothetical protein
VIANGSQGPGVSTRIRADAGALPPVAHGSRALIGAGGEWREQDHECD